METETRAVRLVDARAAAAILGISRATLWRLERSRALQPVRIGRALRYRLADLEALVRRAGAPTATSAGTGCSRGRT